MTTAVEHTVTSFTVTAGNTAGIARIRRRGDANVEVNHPITGKRYERRFETADDARAWLEQTIPDLDRAKALHQLVTDLAGEIADRALKDA